MLVYSCLLFVRTGAIIKLYGPEINSISQTASQIFTYFTLFESGLNSAYLFKMYEPMRSRKYKRINSLYMGLSISLKKISIRMLIILLPVSLLYCSFIDIKMTSYQTAVLIMVLMGVRFIIPYYISLAKKTLLIIHELKYMVDAIDSIINIVIVMMELILITVFKCHIIWTLCCGILVTLFSGMIYLYLIKRSCKESVGNDVRPSFDAEDMTKDIIVHQIGGLSNNNIDTLILSIYDLLSVTAYQAYNTIILYPIQFLNRISETFRASFGLKLLTDKKEAYTLFQELMTVHILAAMVLLPVFLNSVDSFVYLWIGEEYILSDVDVFLFSLILLHRILINPVYIIRDGKGLYHESKWYTVVQSIINLILSVILVKPLGITGLLIGTLIPTYLFCAPCNYYLVYKKVFEKKLVIYIDIVFIFISVLISVSFKRSISVIDQFDFYELNWLGVVCDICLQMLIAVAIGIAVIMFYKRNYMLNLIKKATKMGRN